MTLATRKPTNKVPWPTLLLTGPKGTGKTYTALEASKSPLIDQTYVFTLGEQDPDDYGRIPGVRFESVIHDGSYDSIYGQLRELASLPPTKLPVLTIFDSLPPVWELIVADVQRIANERAALEAVAHKRPAPVGNASITNDLWSDANAAWYRVLNLIVALPGPAIVTARMDETDKGWRVRGQKDLAYDVSGVIELPERGVFRLSKLRSPTNPLAGVVDLTDYSVEQTWRDLGLPDSAR